MTRGFSDQFVISVKFPPQTTTMTRGSSVQFVKYLSKLLSPIKFGGQYIAEILQKVMIRNIKTDVLKSCFACRSFG